MNLEEQEVILRNNIMDVVYSPNLPDYCYWTTDTILDEKLSIRLKWFETMRNTFEEKIKISSILNTSDIINIENKLKKKINDLNKKSKTTQFCTSDYRDSRRGNYTSNYFCDI